MMTIEEKRKILVEALKRAEGQFEEWRINLVLAESNVKALQAELKALEK